MQQTGILTTEKYMPLEPTNTSNGVFNEESDYAKVRNYWKYLKAKLKKGNLQRE